MAEVGPSSREDLFPRREDRLAYYINAYNAFTMFNVLNRYPEITTVEDEKVDFFGLTLFKMDQRKTNLTDLENKTVRPRFKEPRAHFALNCASAGCPVLPATHFAPGRLEEQLAAETVKFLHEERNVRVVGDKIVLSQIFEWYAEDFPPNPAAWVKAQAPDLNVPDDVKTEHTPYDWALNDQNR